MKRKISFRDLSFEEIEFIHSTLAPYMKNFSNRKIIQEVQKLLPNYKVSKEIENNTLLIVIEKAK